jgi:hypothetical protein
MRKWIWFVSLAVVISIVAFRVGRKQDCKISLYYTALSPDAQKSATLYTKQCGAVKAGVAEKEYFVVVMRPVSEPPPIDNRFAESDVIFEVEGRAKIGAGGSPSSHGEFKQLPKEEQDTSILIECLDCDRQKILKQLHVWRGIPIHYYFSQPSGTNPVIQ